MNFNPSSLLLIITLLEREKASITTQQYEALRLKALLYGMISPNPALGFLFVKNEIATLKGDTSSTPMPLLMLLSNIMGSSEQGNAMQDMNKQTQQLNQLVAMMSMDMSTNQKGIDEMRTTVAQTQQAIVLTQTQMAATHTEIISTKAKVEAAQLEIANTKANMLTKEAFDIRITALQEAMPSQQEIGPA